MLARELMTGDPAVIDAEETLSSAVAMMKTHDVGMLPVVDAQRIVIGVVSMKDLAIGLGPSDPMLVERTIEGISRAGALVSSA